MRGKTKKYSANYKFGVNKAVPEREGVRRKPDGRVFKPSPRRRRCHAVTDEVKFHIYLKIPFIDFFSINGILLKVFSCLFISVNSYPRNNLFSLHGVHLQESLRLSSLPPVYRDEVFRKHQAVSFPTFYVFPL